MKELQQVFYTTFTNRKNQFCLIFTTLCFLVIYYIFLYTKPINIFPSPSKIVINSFDDKFDEGKSEVRTFLLTDTLLTFQYELRKGFSNPYAGISFQPEGGFFGLENFNRVEIDISESTADNLLLYLNTLDPDVRDKGHRLAARHSYLRIESKGHRPIKMDLNDLVTPEWWYVEIGQSPSEFGKIHLENTMNLVLTTGLSPKLNQPEILKIKSIRFYKDNFQEVLILVNIWVCIFLVLFVYEWQKFRKQKRKPIEIKYKAVESPELPEKDNKTFIEYINTHYHDPDLTLSKVAEITGVQERVISRFIADQFECNFKTYINKIRIEEAQRLLTNPKLNISEVAYTVGFNSPNNFNKVFKKLTGKTPSSL
jgi:AraC-like DNA-binding protein